MPRPSVKPGAIRRRLRARFLTALASRGIEIHRSTAVRRTLPAVLAHYRGRGLSPATVIDVGVGPGTPELYEAFPDARLVLVEPLEEWRAHLEQVQRERRAELVFAAAGPHPGQTELALHRVPACSSMIGTRLGEATELPRRTVEMVRLDDLVEDRGLRGPYVVKADVEGAELEVLSGGLEVLAETELVLLEVSLFELVSGAPQFHDVVAWMHEHGFVVADIYNGHNRLLDGALAQFDVAFLPEAGRFRRDQAFATAAQADTLYRAWGH